MLGGHITTFYRNLSSLQEVSSQLHMECYELTRTKRWTFSLNSILEIQTNTMPQQHKKDTTAQDIKRKSNSIKNMSTNCKILVWKAVFVIYWQKLEEYLYGHPTLRKVISKSAEDIVSKIECDDHQPSVDHQRQAYTLPRLPVPVDEMNAPTVKTVMTYLAKDLGISFKHPCLSSGHNLYIFAPDRPGEFRGLRTQRLCNTVYASSVAL